MIRERFWNKEKDISGIKKQFCELLECAWQKGYNAGFSDGYDTRREADGKSYEERKASGVDNIITKAISEELEALPKEIDGDMLLMLSMFGVGVRVNILGKLRERGDEE